MPVAMNTAMIAASRRAANDLPWQAFSSSDSSTLVIRMAMLDLRAARAEDAAACLREALQIADRADMPLTVDNALNCCGHLCAATGRDLEAVTVWAAADAFWKGSRGHPLRRAAAMRPCARPGGRWDPPGPGRRRTAARR
jgi:hypothetical protein